MKTLITSQFNEAMVQLPANVQQEVSSFIVFVKSSDREHIVASSFTKIISEDEDIFTLRGKNARMFCTFLVVKGSETIVFLDVHVTKTGTSSNSYSYQKLEGEVTLFGSSGEPVAYIEDDSGKTIFTFSGEPMAYIDSKLNVYGFNGQHLGWFKDEVIRNHNGEMVGFTKNTCPKITMFEPYKGFKQFKPFKGFKEFEPFKPLDSVKKAEIGLLEFLKSGR